MLNGAHSSSCRPPILSLWKRVNGHEDQGQKRKCQRVFPHIQSFYSEKLFQVQTNTRVYREPLHRGPPPGFPRRARLMISDAATQAELLRPARVCPGSSAGSVSLLSLSSRLRCPRSGSVIRDVRLPGPARLLLRLSCLGSESRAGGRAVRPCRGRHPAPAQKARTGLFAASCLPTGCVFAGWPHWVSAAALGPSPAVVSRPPPRCCAQAREWRCVSAARWHTRSSQTGDGARGPCFGRGFLSTAPPGKPARRLLSFVVGICGEIL